MSFGKAASSPSIRTAARPHRSERAGSNAHAQRRQGTLFAGLAARRHAGREGVLTAAHFDKLPSNKRLPRLRGQTRREHHHVRCSLRARCGERAHTHTRRAGSGARTAGPEQAHNGARTAAARAGDAPQPRPAAPSAVLVLGSRSLRAQAESAGDPWLRARQARTRPPARTPASRHTPPSCLTARSHSASPPSRRRWCPDPP